MYKSWPKVKNQSLIVKKIVQAKLEKTTDCNDFKPKTTIKDCSSFAWKNNQPIIGKIDDLFDKLSWSPPQIVQQRRSFSFEIEDLFDQRMYILSPTSFVVINLITIFDCTVDQTIFDCSSFAWKNNYVVCVFHGGDQRSWSPNQQPGLAWT